MKGVIDILGIALPIVLLIVFFFRSKSKTVNALGILLTIALLAAGILRYVFFSGSKSASSKEPDPVPLTVSKHSDAFNNSLQTALSSYYNMSEAFVNWDTEGVNKTATDLKSSLGAFTIDELQTDTTGIYESALDPLNNVKSSTDAILSAASIDEKRTAFNQLSENLRLLLIVVKYDQSKLYWQECPMAFGDIAGNWLSKTDSVRNPYLGLKHPKYGSEMLNCGAPKDTINFMIAAK